MSRLLQASYDPAQLHEFFLAGARDTADAIIQLTKGIEIQSVLDIGSGTGAVLQRLDERGFADHYYALEPSPELVEFMRDRNQVSRLEGIEQARLEKSDLGKRRYDLAMLCHVLGHVTDPAVCSPPRCAVHGLLFS